MDEVTDSDFQLTKVRFKKLYKKAKDMGISDADIRKLAFVTKHKPKSVNIIFLIFKWIFYFIIGISFLLLSLYGAVQKELVEGKILADFSTIFTNIDMSTDQCIIPFSETVLDFFRPPVDCDFCKGIIEFDRVEQLDPKDFVAKYAYSGRPVIVTDAMLNWTAHKHFSFDFFKKLYKRDSPVLNPPDDSRGCQFFPYKTKFQSLIDVFKMPRKMVEMKGEPWYVGWSNCDPEAANILREHYQQPYFLSQDMESSKTDWIFMGTPGYGAHIHIDSVERSSWQGQVHGNKTWTLQPPPECYYKCGGGFKDTVHAGEIIVLDTNKWFHGTQVVGDQLSIVIGSEYD